MLVYTSIDSGLFRRNATDRYGLVSNLLEKKEKDDPGLSKYSEQFERVAGFQVRLGDPLDHGVVKSLSGKFFSVDACCFVRLVFQTEGLDAEADAEFWEEQEQGPDDFWQIPFCVSGHGHAR
jgi:hypothetical protein